MAGTGVGGSSATAKFLLGGAGILQAALTALGVSNGGVAEVAVNELGLLILGGACVLIAVMSGAVLVLRDDTKTVLSYVGLVFLFGGIAIAGYAALVAPTLTSAPKIDLIVTTGAPPNKDLHVEAEVRATAIANADLYFVEIDGLKYVHGTQSYNAVGSPIYLAELGADGAGHVDAKINVPVPEGRYSALSLQGWSGAHPGPCQSVAAPHSASTQADHQDPLGGHGRDGCVVVRVPPS